MSKTIVKLTDDKYLDSNNVIVANDDLTIYDTLYNELYYKKGDVLTLSNSMVFAGHLTTSATSIQASFCLPKKIGNDVSKMTLSGTLTIRHSDGGYIANNASSADTSVFSSITLSQSIDNVVYVQIKLADTASFANNSVVSVFLYDGATITFS